LAECNSCGSEYNTGTEGSDFGLCPKCYAETSAQIEAEAARKSAGKTKPETTKLAPKEWSAGILFLLGITAFILFFVFIGYAISDEKINDLTNADSSVRQSAAVSLGENGEESAVDDLITVLQEDKDSAVRTSAANALGNIGDTRAIEPLKTALREDSSPYVRQSAVQALSAFGPAQALEPVLSALQDEDSSVRMQAALELANMDDARAVESLNAALDEGDTAVAAGAYKFFIQQGKAGSENLLIAALNEYGGTTMANKYLNSGNALLENAARDWAEAHGYDIEPYYGKMDGNSWGGN